MKGEITWKPLFKCNRCGRVSNLGEYFLPDTSPDRADGAPCPDCEAGKMRLCPYGCLLPICEESYNIGPPCCFCGGLDECVEGMASVGNYLWQRVAKASPCFHPSLTLITTEEEPV